jgi:hypothetical protein
MTREELVITMAATLIGAVIIGWIRWIYGGLSRAGTAKVETVDDMCPLGWHRRRRVRQRCRPTRRNEVSSQLRESRRVGCSDGRIAHARVNLRLAGCV